MPGAGATGGFVSAVSTASCDGGDSGCGEIGRQQQQQPWSADGAEGRGGSRVSAAAAASAAAPVARRWAMSDLRMCGGPYDLYDNDLLSLLYGRPYDGAVLYDGPCATAAGPAREAASMAEGRADASCSTPTTSHNHGVASVDREATDPQTAAPPHAPLYVTCDSNGASSTGGRTATCPPPPSPSLDLSLPRLHTLALVGLPRLSYGLLTHMAQYGTALRNVRLEGCGYLGAGARRPPPPAAAATPSANLSSPPAAPLATAGGIGMGKAAAAAAAGVGGVDSANGDGGGGSGTRHEPAGDQQQQEPGAPWCSAAVLRWLARCPRLTNLRLRHCCQVRGEHCHTITK